MGCIPTLHINVKCSADTAIIFFFSPPVLTFPPERCFEKEGPIQTFPSPLVKWTAFVPSLEKTLYSV